MARTPHVRSACSSSLIARWIALLCCVVVALWARPVAAFGKVVVAVAGQGEIETELRARITTELGTRGHTVIEVPLAAHELAAITQALRQQQQRADAVAAVAVLVQARRVQILLVTGPGPSSSQSLSPGRNLASAVALLVGEAVDVALVTPLPQEQVPASVPATTPSHAARAEPARAQHLRAAGGPPSWYADVAVAMAWPVRYRLPTAQTVVAIGLRPHRRVRAGIEGVLPLYPLRDQLDAGRLDTFVFGFGLGTDVNVLPTALPLRLDLHSGVHALALRLRARGARRVTETTWSAAAVAGIWLRGAVHEHVELGLGVRMTVPFEHLRIRLAGEPAQDLGIVWPGLGVSVGARW